MKIFRLNLIQFSLAFVIFIISISFSITANAQYAYESFNSWNNNFLVQNNGAPYYATTVVSSGTAPELGGNGALAIAVAEDAYDGYTNHSTLTQTLINSLLKEFLVLNGSSWSSNTSNRDVSVIVNAFLRGYQITGNATFLTAAENGWNLAYSRGYSPTLGGGIWDDTTKSSKSAFTNSIYAYEAILLYQITGTSSYLSEAKSLYNWVDSNLVTSSYEVNHSISSNGSVVTGSDANDEGAFILASAELYRVIGDSSYFSNAFDTTNNRIGLSPILSSITEGKTQWAYWLTLGISRISAYGYLWNYYQAWFESNAGTAWQERDTVTNLTWNNWLAPTNVTSTNPVDTGSAVAIQQELPPTSPTLTGVYEIQNVKSGLVLNIKGNSTSPGAAVIQYPFASGQVSSLWNVYLDTGGYYQIQNDTNNANNILSLSIAGSSVTPGALAVMEIPPFEQAVPGSFEWVPVLNSDGTYSFYNLNSHLALDDTGASTAPGTQYQQWWPNGTDGQKFRLIPQ